MDSEMLSSSYSEEECSLVSARSVNNGMTALMLRYAWRRRQTISNDALEHMSEFMLSGVIFRELADQV